MENKILIYQVFPRLFGNSNPSRQKNGTLKENGVGKFNDLDAMRLKRIGEMGFSHVWFTGVIRHATTTDYSEYGIPSQHPAVVKGLAGSPYAITDYYDVDPDLATEVGSRMEEFERLIERSHKAGLKVIIDFVPNHVAREYKSVCKPEGVEDLGEGDDTNKFFDPNNNFYYCPGQSFVCPVAIDDSAAPYVEYPAKCTGNDRFDNSPSVNDWFETVKLNYGVDYWQQWDGRFRFDPMPDTWIKMTEILLFWTAKGVDGFRCDMAEMVPTHFWEHATGVVKQANPSIIFIGEVYNTNNYRSYINAGFDFLYDKVGMYDCVREVVCNRRPASSITGYWQNVDDIKDHMLYFLENHDEQRIASDYFCGDPFKAIPGVLVLTTLLQNPFMLYSGQEFGEAGMDEEGFSGLDGRTTIFDYWHLEKLYRGYFDRKKMTQKERRLEEFYRKILRIANTEKAITQGAFFDLMYANPSNERFNPWTNFAFLRKYGQENLLIVANFSDEKSEVDVTIPEHAFEVLGLSEGYFEALDLLSGEKINFDLRKGMSVRMDVLGQSGRILKFNDSGR